MSVYAIFNPCPILTFSDAGDHCDDIAIFCDDFCDDYGDAPLLQIRSSPTAPI